MTIAELHLLLMEATNGDLRRNTLSVLKIITYQEFLSLYEFCYNHLGYEITWLSLNGEKATTVTLFKLSLSYRNLHS